MSITIPKHQPDLFLLILCVLITILVLFSGCCPQIVESSETKRDSITEYSSGVFTINDSSKFVTAAKYDSVVSMVGRLLSGIKYPLIVNVPVQPSVISTNTKKGVTTSLKYDQGNLYCETTIDSLRAVIDSIPHKIVTITNTITKTVIKSNCNKQFHTFTVVWFFASLVVLTLIFKIK